MKFIKGWEVLPLREGGRGLSLGCGIWGEHITSGAVGLAPPCGLVPGILGQIGLRRDLVPGLGWALGLDWWNLGWKPSCSSDLGLVQKLL